MLLTGLHLKPYLYTVRAAMSGVTGPNRASFVELGGNWDPSVEKE